MLVHADHRVPTHGGARARDRVRDLLFDEGCHTLNRDLLVEARRAAAETRGRQHGDCVDKLACAYVGLHEGGGTFMISGGHSTGVVRRVTVRGEHTVAQK